MTNSSNKMRMSNNKPSKIPIVDSELSGSGQIDINTRTSIGGSTAGVGRGALEAVRLVVALT